MTKTLYNQLEQKTLKFCKGIFMKLIFSLIISMFLLLGCGDSNAKWESPEYDPHIVRIQSTQSSWYELPQYYNGVPKYSGPVGTFPQQTMPSAVKCELGTWATYSNNRDGNLNIYVVKLETQQSYLVHVVAGQVDAHQNAAIQCGGGKLWLAVSARGYKREGYLYSSSNGINWQLESTGMRSYPQLHWRNGSLLFLYTEYKMDITQQDGVSRKIYSSCNNQPIINDDIQHYMQSYVDTNGRVHVVFNDLIGGPDFRTNLNYTYSDNGGCSWSTPVRWHTGDFVYLKDFRNSGDTPYALVVLSDSADPTIGTRRVAIISPYGTTIRGTTNHNYTTGAMTTATDLVFPDGGSSAYAGGSLLDAAHVNYVKRIFGTTNQFVASEGISSQYPSDSWLIWIKE